jgi:hypothetical protein
MKAFREAAHATDYMYKVKQAIEQSKAEQARWIQAVQNDLRTNEAILLELHSQIETNQRQQQAAISNIGTKLDHIERQRKAEMDNIYGNFEHLGKQAYEQTAGVHEHIGDVNNNVNLVKAGVDDANQKLSNLHIGMVQGQQMMVSQLDRHSSEIKKLINRSLMKQLDNIKAHQVPSKSVALISKTSSHFIYKVEYIDVSGNEDSRAVCIFKAINAGSSHTVNEMELARREIEMLALTKLQDSPYFPAILGRFKKDAVTVGFIMEGAFFGDTNEPITLRHYLDNNIVEWSMRIRLIRQLCSAMVYMHAKHQDIIHGGLNSNDILIALDNKGYEHIKIIDFDRSQIANGNTYRPFNDYGSRVEHYPYTAPELFTKKFTTKATDIFAVGTILWELGFCAVPYEHIDPDSVRAYIIKGDRDLVPQGDIDGCPFELADAILRCWDGNASKRPTALALDELLYDLYKPNRATARTVVSETTRDSVTQWREVYLRARMGVSEDDLVSVRIVAEILTHPRFAPGYAKSAEKRKEEAIHLCKVSVSSKEDGGAAYYLATKLYGLNETEEFRSWLNIGKKLGHPSSILTTAKMEYETKQIDESGFREMAAGAKDESVIRDQLNQMKKQQRMELTKMS